MYLAYFFNNEGQYHAAIPLESEVELFEAVVRYKGTVPRIMVTDSQDCSVLEAEDGVIVFPDVDAQVRDVLDGDTELFDDDQSIEEMVQAYRHVSEKYLASGGRDKESFAEMERIELDLFALAAKEDVRLHTLGWKYSALIRSEAEAAW